MIEEDDEILSVYSTEKFKVIARKDRSKEAVQLVEIFMEELENYYKELSNTITLETLAKYI